MFYEEITTAMHLKLTKNRSSAFAIIFADCHGLSCVHVRASWYTAPFRVSLHAATRVAMFFPFYLFVFLFSFLHYHACMLF